MESSATSPTANSRYLVEKQIGPDIVLWSTHFLNKPPHTGKLVPPKDPTALARAIRELAQNPESALRFGEAGRACIEANFRASLGAETLVSEILAAQERG